MKPLHVFSVQPPLTDEQRAEVLRLARVWERQAQHNLRIDLHAHAARERDAARATLHEDRAAEHRGAAKAFERAVELLDKCWPADEQRGLTPQPVSFADLPLGPGEDDAEVWIPPKNDCLLHQPKQPCPHCGDEYFHVRTGRCPNCGRRPGVPATAVAVGE